jgi:hypothetical protein
METDGRKDIVGRWSVHKPAGHVSNDRFRRDHFEGLGYLARHVDEEFLEYLHADTAVATTPELLKQMARSLVFVPGANIMRV